MAINDPVGDMLTRIRNGQRARMSSVTSPASGMRTRVLDVLEKEGYIRGYLETRLRPGIAELTIELKYSEGRPVIREITRVSTPGCRIYSRIKELNQVYGGLGIAILSTPKGVLSDNDARAENVGGEVLCQVF